MNITDFPETAFDQILLGELTDMVVNSPVIYKYISFDIGKKALEHSTIGFTNPLAFNDPYDCWARLIDFSDLPEDYRMRLIDLYYGHFDEANKRAMLEHMHKTPDEVLTKLLSTQGMSNEVVNRGVSCFSRNYNNILMWSHYAASHTGICIGFNLEKLFLNISEISPEKMMLLVDYKDELTPLNYYRHKRESIVRWLKTKAKCWAYEQEIRIVMNHLNFNLDTKFIQEIHRDCFHSVYFGTRMAQPHKDEIAQLCKQHYPGVSLYNIRPDEDKFELKGEPLQC